MQFTELQLRILQFIVLQFTVLSSKSLPLATGRFQQGFTTINAFTVSSLGIKCLGEHLDMKREHDNEACYTIIRFTVCISHLILLKETKGISWTGHADIYGEVRNKFNI